MTLKELREHLDSAKEDGWNSISFGIEEVDHLVAVAEAVREFWFLAGPSRDGGSLGTKQAVLESQTKVTKALKALEGE